MRKLLRVVLYALTLSTMSLQTASADHSLVINTGFTPPVSSLFNDIMIEVGKRTGHSINFQEISAERSLALVNNGVDDAECCRIPKVVMGDYPNLLVVPESVFTVRFVAFSQKPGLKVSNWDDLKPHSVGTVTGWKILVKNIERIQPDTYHILDNADAMFKMLQLGRLDVATLGYLSGLDVLDKLAIDDIQVQEPPLATRDLYLMLHKRHANLIQPVTTALREMKADGTMDKIVNKIQKPKGS